MKLFRLTVLCVAISFSQVFAASLMEEKLNLEKSIQGNVERLVEKIIGSTEMVVLVNVELGEEAPKTEAGKLLYPGMGMTEEEYLPGVTYTNVPFGGAGGASPKGALVKKITVSITLDQMIGEALVARIKKEVMDLIGLDPIRGDVVNVQRIAFLKPNFTFKEYIQGNWFKQGYWPLLFIVITVFLFGPLRSFFKNVLKAMELKINADTRIRGSEGAGPGSGATMTGQLQIGALPGATSEKDSGGKEKDKIVHFSFVNKENLKNLIYLAKKETPDNIAIVINYLSPGLASSILSSLTVQVQNEVIKNLAEVKLLDPKQVKMVEEDLGQKIAYLAGGEEYFLNLIEHSDPETHLNVINALDQANPTMAERVRREMFFFDDINILERIALQRLVRESQRRGYSLALALKTAHEDLKNRVLSIMTEDAKAMLNEQMELLGELSDKRIAEEQRSIASLARELEKNGLIIIDRRRKLVTGDETEALPV